MVLAVVMVLTVTVLVVIAMLLVCRLLLAVGRGIRTGRYCMVGHGGAGGLGHGETSPAEEEAEQHDC